MWPGKCNCILSNIAGYFGSFKDFDICDDVSQIDVKNVRLNNTSALK